MNESEIQLLIEEKLPESQVAVVDTRGSGDHFEIMVISDNFEGISLIDRHRIIHSALGENLGGSIHAVEIKAYTPKQWEALA